MLCYFSRRVSRTGTTNAVRSYSIRDKNAAGGKYLLKTLSSPHETQPAHGSGQCVSTFDVFRRRGPSCLTTRLRKHRARPADGRRTVFSMQDAMRGTDGRTSFWTRRKWKLTIFLRNGVNLHKRETYRASRRLDNALLVNVLFTICWPTVTIYYHSD